LSLRTKFAVYLVAVHLPFAALAVYALRKNPFLLVAAEVAFVASLVYGFRLVRGYLGLVERVRDGSRFIAEGDFTARFRPTGNAETDALVDVYNRMAESLREERVRNQEQNFFLERVLDASPFGLVTFDYDGRIASVSPGAERLLGFGAAAALGREPAELDHPNAAALAGLGDNESRVVAFTGNRRVKVQRGTFMDRGFPRSFVTLAELTEELRRSEKAAYEKLIRMMSHEVNNTVAASTSILHACLALAPDVGDDDREDYETGLRTVIERTDRLNAFMRGFADVVRLPDPKLAPCDLAPVLEHILDLMRATATDRGVAFVRELASDVPPVPLDRVQMEQVFVNVVKNAVEAAGPGGVVTVRLDAADGVVRAVVEDSGPGISPDVADRLFTPFFTTKQEGQGIGLTVVQEVLTRHGFTFSLESRPGEPTRFTVVFAPEHSA
jgi:nitrogen fixation/metabolism regulation signal transduction histidine kinase